LEKDRRGGQTACRGSGRGLRMGGKVGEGSVVYPYDGETRVRTGGETEMCEGGPELGGRTKRSERYGWPKEASLCEKKRKQGVEEQKGRTNGPRLRMYTLGDLLHQIKTLIEGKTTGGRT